MRKKLFRVINFWRHITINIGSKDVKKEKREREKDSIMDQNVQKLSIKIYIILVKVIIENYGRDPYNLITLYPNRLNYVHSNNK